MTVIGLAGGSGSGKSTVSGLFAEHGILPINTDEIYHNLTSSYTPCLKELVEEFGDRIITKESSLDRKRLAEIVFADSNKLARLNAISHYYVLSSVREIISLAERQGIFAVIVDAPLLFESGFDRECDVIVAVVADEATRMARITVRDSISVDAAKKRINAQLSDEYLSARADYIIGNNGTIDDLRSKILRIVNQIKNNK